MRDLPDFTQYDYQILKCLNENCSGGRLTYLANDLVQKQKVIIKQFIFARPDSDWNSYKSLEREIKNLQTINHPFIPKYLNSFDSNNGLCLVSEYIDASPLSTKQLEVKQIHEITLKILEILVYLQSLSNSIVHGDIKPENILLDSEGEVYLIDFGLANTTEKILSVSTANSGTLGFIPPESLWGHKLSANSDLFSLAVTIYCLLTQTTTKDFSNHVDYSTNKIPVSQLKNLISSEFLNWIETCSQPKSSDRFINAATALKQLQQINPISIKEKPSSNIQKAHQSNSQLTDSKNFAYRMLTLVFLLLMSLNTNNLSNSG